MAGGRRFRGRQRVDAGGGASVAGRDLNTVVNVGLGRGEGAVPAAAGSAVVGEVPQEPAAFQFRAGLAEALERGSGGGVRVVFAVTGIRGVGKTQAAAACARRRINEKWRLVAWVDAGDEASLLAGLARVAEAAGIGGPGDGARELAAGVRGWLEADGERRLLVFDNADDPGLLRPFLPAAGAAQVIVTSSRQSAAGLGVPVPVEVFAEEEALAFLAGRTGLADEDGARELAAELGFLPLGLAQAAALIARERLDYATYLERLRSLSVAGYLAPEEGDGYPCRVAEAVELSLRAVGERDPSGACGRLLELVSVLAETGVPRGWLRPGAGAGAPRRRLPRLRRADRAVTEADVDAGLGALAEASLAGFSVDGRSVIAHRLVMRVVRERLAAGGGLRSAVDGAVRVLAAAADGISEAWHDPVVVRDLAGQVSAVMACRAAHPDVFSGPVPEDLLGVRLRSVYLLNELGDSTGLAIAAAEPLAADCERLLGDTHPDTLASRNNLAVAYRDAGRTGEAIPVLERTLADCERLLGDTHPDTLASRNNLAVAYRAAGRTGEAIPLYERTLADRKRLLGDTHPDTLTSRNNLAVAYRAAGRTGEAIPLYERTLADRKRLLGDTHPDTLTSRNNLAAAYQDAGRTGEAIPVLERTLADRKRLLGDTHPDTLASRNNLAVAYRDAGRTGEAIPVLERTLADCERLLGDNHPNTKVVRANLARAQEQARSQ